MPFEVIYLGAGFLVALALCAWPDRRLKRQLEDAMASLGRREAFIESMTRTHAAERKAMLERMEVHTDDGGVCRTIPRDRKSVIELLSQRRRRQADEEKTWDETYKPLMEPDAAMASEPTGEQ